jgi:hypothetical protein
MANGIGVKIYPAVMFNSVLLLHYLISKQGITISIISSVIVCFGVEKRLTNDGV